ncbi:MAG: 3-hydroxyacyl-CoA dehydrogenase NAD-binding domain-containing protein, partial [Pseudomonadota bacterium]|nr:3-hydroxyacyl-CoA dehydrogenase NAD-binding domain-containing protein [Pseudomonadota bacterium]
VNGSIAIITLNATPVNSLGHGLRKAINDAFEKATNDAEVEAIVVTSAVKLFCGGADITEIGTDRAFAEPNLPYLCDTLEASSKPVVAAINGMALGGGLELALGADYRFAHPVAKLGLPEVNLGILPGAGGTQRVPRLAGVPLALKMITSGAPISAVEAQQAGLVDQLFDGEGDFVDAAVAYAEQLLESGAPLKSCADIEVDTSELADNYFEEFAAGLARKTRGYFAPAKCIEAVQIATTTPLAEGLKREGELFAECADTPQARAQQHLFFAERAAGVIPGVDPKVALRDVRKVAVIGAGTMGGGIAMNFANAGIPVTLLEIKQEFLDNGLAKVRQNYEISAKRGRMTQDDVEQRMSLFSGTTDYADLADVDLVIEAVFESMEVKQQVFKQLDAVCKPGCILASNTSTLDVNEIAAVTKRPEDVLGLHF